MKYKMVTCILMFLITFQTFTFAEPEAVSVPVVKAGQEEQFGAASPASSDGSSTVVPYAANVAVWFESSGNTTYHLAEEISQVKLNTTSGELTYKPSRYDVGKLVEFYVYAENEAGRSQNVVVKVQVNKVQNAQNSVISVEKDTYQTANGLEIPSVDYEYQKFAFAGDVAVNGNILLKALLDDLELTKGIQYTFENKDAVFGGDEIKVFGIKKEICKDLSEGKHTVTLIFSGGDDIQFDVFIQDLTQYQVSYASQLPDESGVSVFDQLSCTKGGTVSLPNIIDTKKYRFSGWWSVTEDSEASVEYTSQTPILSNVSLKARWEERTYSVIFMNDDTEYKKVEAKYADTVTLPDDPIKNGYDFDGWFIGENGSGEKIIANAVIESDLTVYSHWIKRKSSGTHSSSAKGPSIVISFSGEDKPVRTAPAAPYMKGYPDGTFKPDAPVTRAESAEIMTRIATDFDNSNSYPNIFEDIDAAQWYGGAVSYLNQKLQFDSKEFYPEENITRLDFCVWLSKFLNLDPATEVASFDDLNGVIGAEYINTLQKNKIVTGYDDNTFRPDEPLTRAEATVLINRALSNNEPTNGRVAVYKDVPVAHWAYTDIVKASAAIE